MPMSTPAVPPKKSEPVTVAQKKYRVTSRVYADARYGDVVVLTPTGAVDALVEGGHLSPVEDRPVKAESTKKEQ